MNKICIIGVGLIGGSVAKGLRKTNQVKHISGFGRAAASLKIAQKLGVIDDYSLDLKTAIKDAEMVIIATPVNSFSDILSLIKPHLDSQTIITDVGSTKVNIIKIARTVFGKMPINFVPSHPIAGKEKSGVEASDDGLFQGKRVILTPTAKTSSQAISKVSELWQILGAKVETMDAQQHDNLLAMTSHLPHILAFGLMDYLITNQQNACDYAAGGFKDFSRIASSDATMWRDICLNNETEIIKHIKGYQHTLDKIIGLIDDKNSTELAALFKSAKQNRDRWLGQKI